MKRSLGRNLGWAACGLTCLFLSRGGLMAQAPEQHWQPSQNYPSNNPPAYQASTAPANPATPGNPVAVGSTMGQNPASQNPSGQYQYPQQPNTAPGPQQYPQYPTIEQRQSGQQGYGNTSPANSATYPQQYPRAQAGALQNSPGAGGVIQGPPPRNQPPKAPFVLTPPEATALDNLLNDWEKRNKEIQVLESKFYRWKYDTVFGNGNQPPPFEEGELKFASPDKGLMKIETKDPKQSEQWLCDGKSINQFDYPRKLVTEYVMPPELQGKGIGDGPLPFVFGIEAEKLKQRYFMRIITPPNVQNAVWLEAYPRYQQQAAEFSKVEVILQIAGTTRALLPFAINIYAPNGKDHIVYQLQNPTINPRVLFGGVFNGWTRVSIPFGWTKKTELPPPPIQAGLTPSNLPRR